MDHLGHRVGESGLLPFRARRVFNIGTEWFFAVRDGKDCGPFENQQDATIGLEQFLSNQETRQSAVMN